MSKNNNFINAFFLIAQPLLLNAISIPATAYIIRRLGPFCYGQWSTSVSIVAVLSFITSLGLRPQFIRSIAQEPGNASEILANQLGLRTVLTMLAVLCAFIVCWSFHYGAVVRACILITAIGLILVTGTSTLIDLLQGLKYIRHYAIINLVSGLVLTAFTILAVWWNTGPVGLSAAYLTGPLVQLCMLFALVRRLGIPIRLHWTVRYARTVLTETSAWTASAFLNTLRDRLELLMIPRLLGLSIMGYYTAGIMPADKLQVVPDGLATAFYPAIAGDACNEQQRLKIIQLLTISMVICLGCATLLYALSGVFANIFFPRSAGLCRYIIQVTALALPFIGIVYPISSSLIASGEQPMVARASIYATCISMIASVVVILHSGLNGACWSYVLRFTVPVIFLVPCLGKSFPGLLARVPIAKVFFSAGIMAIFLMTAINIVRVGEDAHVMSTFFSLGLGFVALVGYIGMLLLLKVIRRDDVGRIFTRNLEAKKV